jgi:hypothetical protein
MAIILSRPAVRDTAVPPRSDHPPLPRNSTSRARPGVTSTAINALAPTSVANSIEIYRSTRFGALSSSSRRYVAWSYMDSASHS